MADGLTIAILIIDGLYSKELRKSSPFRVRVPPLSLMGEKKVRSACRIWPFAEKLRNPRNKNTATLPPTCMPGENPAIAFANPSPQPRLRSPPKTAISFPIL